MSDVIINGMDAQEDPREKMAHEVCGLIRSAAEVAEMAIRSGDPKASEALKNSAKVLLQTAQTKMDESVGTKVADETDDDE